MSFLFGACDYIDASGKRLTAKVGNDWVIVDAIPAATRNLFRHVEYTGSGYLIRTRVFIDRKLELTVPLVTK